MWMICGMISVIFCVAAWVMFAKKSPKAIWASACSFAFVSLTLLMEYRMVADWVKEEDWVALLDVVPTMFWALTGYVIIMILANIIPILRPCAPLYTEGKVNRYNAEFWDALDELVNNSEIVIDRPKGTSHPKYPDFIYRLDYGYLKDTTSMDGTGIDVWVGSGKRKIDAVMCIVDLMKKDSEIKILIGCTEEEKSIVYETHNETQFMKGVLIRR